MSSGAIVVSVSVAQLLIASAPGFEWAWLLPTAWVFLGVSVLAGISRQGWTGAARSVRAHLEGKRAEIRSALWKLTPGPDFADQVDSILNDAMVASSVVPDRAVKVHEALNRVVYWTFAGGLGALIIFTIKNMSF